MPSLEAKVRFAEKYLTTPDGEPFSLKGRQWVLDQLWRPLDGWKLWPVDRSQLCAECAAKANTIVDSHDASAPSRSRAHAKTGCLGLKSEPILIVAADLKRQTGKSINTAGWALARAFKDDHESIALLAGSEDQVRRLFTKYYQKPVQTSKKLKGLAHVIGAKLTVPTRHSEIELLPTSMSSVGDTRTAVVIDECRIVPPGIAVALIPTLFARGGWQCPHYHFRTHKGAEDPDAPRECSVCGSATHPWYGKAMLLSSASELTDSDQDWFFEFVTHFLANPHPNVHVFVSDENLNPKIAQKVVDAAGEIFGALESTKLFAGIEVGNLHLRKDQQFMSKADVKRCTTPSLRNLESLTTPCVGFLDTSITVEKTAQVILADNVEISKTPWEFVYQARLDYWLPSASHTIDTTAVAATVRATLSLFSGLRVYYIDTRGMPWAVDLYRALQKEFPRLVRAWTTNDAKDSEIGWRILASRMLARPRPQIELQDCEAQTKEFEGLQMRARYNDSTPRVVDRDRRKSHKDITECDALCCYIIEKEKLRASAHSFANWQSKTGAEQVRSVLNASSIVGSLGDNAF
jgi:hypothetical protein